MLTIHNLAYQGVAGGEWLSRIGPRAAHFEWYGGTNPLAGALALADRIVTVSPTYAAEITTPGGGFGLDGPLRARGSALIGILNGIDTESWDPAGDPRLPAPFDHRRLPARALRAAPRCSIASSCPTTAYRSRRSSPGSPTRRASIC